MLLTLFDALMEDWEIKFVKLKLKVAKTLQNAFYGVFSSYQVDILGLL